MEEASRARIIYPRQGLARDANVSGFAEYHGVYERSTTNPEEFWGLMAEQELEWDQKWRKVLATDELTHESRWFRGGKLNASVNCLDRHINSGRADKLALIWEPDDPAGQSLAFSYRELYEEVCEFGNVLKAHGVVKGDTVCIYLPMVPQLVIAMLACARIGAVHSVVFGGFSAQALRKRIADSGAKIVVTADGGFRAGKVTRLKANVDEACRSIEQVKTVVVVRRTGIPVMMVEGRDFWWQDEMASVIASAECGAETVEANDPLFLLYTSGSTGPPKGIVHSTGGYLLYAALTHKWIFDIKEEDIWFCTADIGWITGHSYLVYGPLANGATTVMFEGVPTFPDPGRFWRICEKFGVTGFYTDPTAIRALMRYGDDWTRKNDLSSLKVLGSVGEPINPEVWLWYYEKIGGGRCPVLDTWWQTETGGIMISPIAGASPMKPGSASFPFPGITPAVLKDDGTPAGAGEAGNLVIEKPWPGMLLGVWRDSATYTQAYWTKFPGRFLTGDGCFVDEDGFYWLTGRTDDVIKVSGHRLSTAEIESAAVEQPEVTEAAVVGFPHRIKGSGIYIFASVKDTYYGDYEAEERIAHELFERIAAGIGQFARPDIVQFTPGLPKTRSGKIMRRVLRHIVEGKGSRLGDLSTLADPEVLEGLEAGAKRALAEFDYDKHLEVILTGYPYKCEAAGDKLVTGVCVHRSTE